ncbi:YciI family protein [Nonomuraea sp. B12E4]|uniref:YciI family protein n=1 Tax=Nonomuraea sp. B12E4 TaxID=3153564 RepID=UPI00325F35BC
MKFLLIMQMNTEVWEALTEEERQEVMSGHGEFMKSIQESGEMISTHALADSSNSASVRGTGGAPAVTDGPYLESKEYMGGYYMVDCESRERAIELAKMIPDTRVAGMGVEVRPVMFSAGQDM